MRKLRLFITSIITLLIAGLLFWQYFHDGVPSHHLLQRADLPELSNWWGLLVLPLLSWILLGKIESRINKGKKNSTNLNQSYRRIVALFLVGLLSGLTIAISFVYDYKPILDTVPFIILFLSLFLPIFYAEFMLGFVLGMTYTFGAVLPTLFVFILAGLGFLIYRFIRPLLLRLVALLTGSGKKVKV